MSDPILSKIKLLLKLANSPNPHEAQNAREMADRLISKYKITPEQLKELEDKKPLYGENEKLFVTWGIEGWRQQLALAIGTHFECQIVQEEVVPVDGLHQFNYYVYGDEPDVINVKFVYNAFIKKIEEYILTRCVGRGPIYISSYCEGLVEGIKNNIMWEGIDIPEVRKPSATTNTSITPADSGANLVPNKEEKEKPADKSVDVNSQSLIKDVMAYFKGLDDGKGLSLQDILELEVINEKPQQLSD